MWNEADSGCAHNEVRLVGGEQNYEGVVQVCQNGTWGTYSRRSWNSLDATVVCRQLNLLPSNFSRMSFYIELVSSKNLIPS